MVFLAIILFIALLACWFALPASVTSEAAVKETDALPATTAPKA